MTKPDLFDEIELLVPITVHFDSWLGQIPKGSRGQVLGYDHHTDYACVQFYDQKLKACVPLEKLSLMP